MPAATALVMLIAGLWCQAGRPLGQTLGPEPQAAVRELMESLPPKSMWRNMLEHGARGDGIRQPWMDEMGKHGVKLAVLTFEFDWNQGGRVLKDWRLVSTEYFTNYDYRNSGPVTDTRRLGRIATSGLATALETVALAWARHSVWSVEAPGNQHPPQGTGTGYQQIFLADNEWLPVQMFPWLGQYQPGTTPLMHAAMLGDVVWIDKLLAGGAEVDTVSPGGWTALGWAAASGGPAAIRALLDAGAAVNLNPDGTGDALLVAVVSDHPENVKVLLKAGADPNSRNAEGQTVLRLAIYRNYGEIVELLRQAGAHE